MNIENTDSSASDKQIKSTVIITIRTPNKRFLRYNWIVNQQVLQMKK